MTRDAADPTGRLRYMVAQGSLALSGSTNVGRTGEGPGGPVAFEKENGGGDGAELDICGAGAALNCGAGVAAGCHGVGHAEANAFPGGGL